MAGIQPARAGAGETIDGFMERRHREAARREAAEAAGRDTWAASTGTGQSWAAPSTADVVALGARILDARGPAAFQAAPAPRRATAVATSQSVSNPPSQRSREAGSRYGSLYAPPPGDLAELRRQQAEFARTTRDISKQNSWMAIPALAPAAVVLGLEGAGAIAARFAAPQLQRGPLVLTERMPHLRGGDNWATRAGRRAHQALKARVDQKPGWGAEQGVKGGDRLLRPDVRAPARDPANPATRFQMELKPNTPSGRRAAARAVEQYTRETGNKTRGIYYDPKAFM